MIKDSDFTIDPFADLEAARRRPMPPRYTAVGRVESPAVLSINEIGDMLRYRKTTI